MGCRTEVSSKLVVVQHERAGMLTPFVAASCRVTDRGAILPVIVVFTGDKSDSVGLLRHLRAEPEC